VILRKQERAGKAILAVALAMSLIAHAGAFASLFQWGGRELGSVDIETSAISVNLEATDVIDAMESAAAKEAASSPAGATAEAAKQTQKDHADPEEQPRLAEQSDTERERAVDEAEIARKVKEEAERDETKRRDEQAVEPQKRTETEEDEEKKPEKVQQSSIAGGAGATGSAESQQSQGRVSASKGSILSYGASLRALISSHTPRNIRKTSLRLAFSVAPLGGLTTIDVISPSNNPEVDKRMIELVQHLSSQFPPPPPGASANQLSFNIEIIFR
jgi:periplasmic protein TonB